MHWPGKTALIVDDNSTNRRIYATQLRHWGMETVAVETAREALECAASQRTFELALFDFEMPEMNGIELRGSVSPVSGSRRGCGSSCAVRQASRARSCTRIPTTAPFHAFLTKPTRLDYMREVIGRLLNGATAPLAQKTTTDLDASLARQHPLRILLAEDNVVNQKVGVALLKRMGYTPGCRRQRPRGVVRRAATDLRRHPDGHPDAGDGRPRSVASDHAAVRQVAAAAHHRAHRERLQDRSGRLHWKRAWTASSENHWTWNSCATR